MNKEEYTFEISWIEIGLTMIAMGLLLFAAPMVLNSSPEDAILSGILGGCCIAAGFLLLNSECRIVRIA